MGLGKSAVLKSEILMRKVNCIVFSTIKNGKTDLLPSKQSQVQLPGSIVTGYCV